MLSQHEILMQDPEFRKEFTVEKFVLESTELLARLMHKKRVSKAELAKRLGKSRAWVTQLLSGGRNVTVRTVAEAAYELGVELQLEPMPLAARSEVARWNQMGTVDYRLPAHAMRVRIINFPSQTSKSHVDAGNDEHWDATAANEGIPQGQVA